MPKRTAAFLFPTMAQSIRLYTSLPISSQIPPVARAGEHFNFSLSPHTFAVSVPHNITPLQADTPPALEYTSYLPDWLTFEPTTLSIHGIPPHSSSVSRIRAAIMASLTVWSPSRSTSPTVNRQSTTSNFTLTLLPASSPPPHMDTPLITTHLKTTTPSHAPRLPVIRIPRGQRFTFGLSEKTPTTPRMLYTAWRISSLFPGSFLPLPEWLEFSSTSSLSFSGIAPLGRQAAQSYTVAVSASTVAGARDTVESLVIVVSHTAHEVEFPSVSENDGTLSPLPLDVTHGSAVSWNVVTDAGLRVDGRAVVRDDLEKVDFDLGAVGVDWLEWDGDSLTLFGVVPFSMPASAAPVSLPLRLTTAYNTSAAITASLPVVFRPSIFDTVPYPTLVVTQGVPFTHILRLSDVARSPVPDSAASMPVLALNASWPASAAWLSFEPTTRTLKGTPPPGQGRSSEVVVAFTAQRRVLRTMSPSSLHKGPSVLYPASTTLSQSDCTLTIIIATGLLPGSQNAPQPLGRTHRARVSRPSKIVLATVLPLSFVLIIVGILWRCKRADLPLTPSGWKRKRRHRSPVFEMSSSSPTSMFFACVGMPVDTVRKSGTERLDEVKPRCDPDPGPGSGAPEHDDVVESPRRMSLMQLFGSTPPRTHHEESTAPTARDSPWSQDSSSLDVEWSPSPRRDAAARKYGEDQRRPRKISIPRQRADFRRNGGAKKTRALGRADEAKENAGMEARAPATRSGAGTVMDAIGRSFLADSDALRRASRASTMFSEDDASMDGYATYHCARVVSVGATAVRPKTLGYNARISEVLSRRVQIEAPTDTAASHALDVELMSRAIGAGSEPADDDVFGGRSVSLKLVRSSMSEGVLPLRDSLRQSMSPDAEPAYDYSPTPMDDAFGRPLSYEGLEELGYPLETLLTISHSPSVPQQQEQEQEQEQQSTVRLVGANARIVYSPDSGAASGSSRAPRRFAREGEMSTVDDRDAHLFA